MTVPGSAGGDYDLRARMVARHMGRHIPGAWPLTICVSNMPRYHIRNFRPSLITVPYNATADYYFPVKK